MGKVLHASASGWFPWCLESQDTSQDTNLIALSPADAMRLYWITRSYRAVSEPATIVFSDPVYTTLIMTFSACNEIDIFPKGSLSSPIQNEERLVCGAVSKAEFSGPSISYIVDGDPGNYGPLGLSVQADYQIFGQENPNGNYFGGNIYIAPFFDQGLAPIFSFGTAENFPVVGQVTWNMLSGVTITKPLTWGLEFASVISGFFSLVISPYSYWSYGGTYNTQTGLPL